MSTSSARWSSFALFGLFTAAVALAAAPAGTAPAAAAASRPSTTRFAKDIAAFEAADLKSPPPKNAFLFVGSSSIRMWRTLAKDFPEVPVINRGFGGSTIRDCIQYADRIVIPYQPRKIIFYAGDNDLASGRTAEGVLEDYKEFVAKIRAGVGADVPIDYISIKPSVRRLPVMEKMRKANALIADYCRAGTNLGYIDVFAPMLAPDGSPRKGIFLADDLHMNAEGYKIWVDLVRPRLK